MPKQHRVGKLVLQEISLVDYPAQQGALVVLEKREFSAEERERLAESGAAMAGGQYPITNGADLRNAIAAFGRAASGERAAVARHIQSRARTLGLTDLLPEEGALADLIGGKMAPKKEDDMDTTMKALLAKMGEMSDHMKNMMEAMPKKPKGVDPMKKKDDAIAALEDKLAKAKDAAPETFLETAPPEPLAAPVQTTAGAAAVAAIERVEKKIDDRLEAVEKSLKAEKARGRAAEFAELGGSVEDRVELAAFLDGLPTERREGVEAILKRGQGATALLKTFGVSTTGDLEKSDDPAVQADLELETLAKARRKENPKLTAEQAYVEVGEENSELLIKAQRIGEKLPVGT